MLKFFTFWRSSAAYRVRIALNLKGIEADHIPVHLTRSGGEQMDDSFRAINPNQTVPVLVLDDSTAITQSLAIITYLDAVHPQPALLPGPPVKRARIEAAAQVIACDVHPINNSRVGQYLKCVLGHGQDEVVDWMRHWMQHGLTAFQDLVEADTTYCFGDQPTLADICLVPQMYNARRWGLDLGGLARLVEIESHCLSLEAFARARPEVQADAET